MTDFPQAREISKMTISQSALQYFISRHSVRAKVPLLLADHPAFVRRMQAFIAFEEHGHPDQAKLRVQIHQLQQQLAKLEANPEPYTEPVSVIQ